VTVDDVEPVEPVYRARRALGGLRRRGVSQPPGRAVGRRRPVL